MAFYLKYRPQRFADLDLAEVREGLAKIMVTKPLPHAFLFAGPKGMGKTSAARIVAKAVNCQPDSQTASQLDSQTASQLKKTSSRQAVQPSSCPAVKPRTVWCRAKLDYEPCNQCDSCLSITAGTNLDVLEIDAASNRGIDDIRSLREGIKLAPIHARYKVYIIDEAHMLTGEAFNALLKTLEEPPPHAIFILCTTRPEKLPETITSRCFVFNFRKAKKEEIVKGLAKIVDEEKLAVEDGVLGEIAQAGGGSFRDSQKLLEQLAAGGQKITLGSAKEVLGRVEGTRPEKLLVLLAEQKTAEAIAELGRVVEEGGDLSWYTKEILEILRIGLLAKFGVKDTERIIDEETDKKLQTLTIEQIKGLIGLFSRAAVDLAKAVVPQLPLEMAVVEWAADDSYEIHKPHETHDPTPPVSSDPGGSIVAVWPRILTEVGPKNHSVQAFLRASRPQSFDGETLTLEVFYEFHKSQLETEKCRHLVEEVATSVLGQPVKLKCILGEKSKPPERKEVKEGVENKEEEDIIKVAEEIFGKRTEQD
jgi:DNA polymerase-3 subunit gamma/tau